MAEVTERNWLDYWQEMMQEESGGQVNTAEAYCKGTRCCVTQALPLLVEQL